MGIGEWTGVAGIGLGIFGFLWKLSHDFAEVRTQIETRMKLFQEETEKKIRETKTEEEAKRGRMFGRLDEVKDHTDQTFVRKDVCSVMHKALVDQVMAGFAQINGRLDKIGGSQAG